MVGKFPLSSEYAECIMYLAFHTHSYARSLLAFYILSIQGELLRMELPSKDEFHIS
jgi:hypothetical protein